MGFWIPISLIKRLKYADFILNSKQDLKDHEEFGERVIELPTGGEPFSFTNNSIVNFHS